MLLITPLEQFCVTMGSFSRVVPDSSRTPVQDSEIGLKPFLLHNSHQTGVKFVL